MGLFSQSIDILVIISMAILSLFSFYLHEIEGLPSSNPILSIIVFRNKRNMVILHKFVLGILACPTHHYRLSFLFNNWVGQFYKSIYNDGIYIIDTNLNQIPILEQKPFLVNKWISKNASFYESTVQLFVRHPSFIDVLVRILSFYGYLAKEKNCSWAFRACDDTFVNVRNLHYLQKDFEKRKNPKSVPHLFGDCLIWGNSYSHLLVQGGTGYIVSYRCLFIFSRYAEEIYRKQFVCDDWDLPRHALAFGVPVNEMKSHYFMGFWMSILPFLLAITKEGQIDENPYDDCLKTMHIKSLCEDVNPKKRLNLINHLVVLHEKWEYRNQLIWLFEKNNTHLAIGPIHDTRRHICRYSNIDDVYESD